MTTRSVAVRAISLIRWLETKMVRPSAARPWSSVRTHRMPSGSRPLTGSSKRRTPGSPSSAEAMPEALAHARARTCPTLPAGHRLQADQLQHLVDPGPRDGVGLGQRQQVVVGGAARGGGPWPRGGRRPRAGATAGRRSGGRRWSPSRNRGGRGPSPCAWSSTCPTRWGRGSPSPPRGGPRSSGRRRPGSSRRTWSDPAGRDHRRARGGRHGSTVPGGAAASTPRRHRLR